MNLKRKRTIHALIAIVLMATAYCILTDREVWPFSAYAMYAGSFHRNATWYTLEAKSAETPAAPVTFNSRDYLYPFAPQEFSESVEKMARDHKENLDPALQKLIKIYSERRLDGLHFGPKLAEYTLLFHRALFRPGLRNQLEDQVVVKGQSP